MGLRLSGSFEWLTLRVSNWTRFSIDTLDTRVDDIGTGRPIELLIQVTETFNNLDSLTCELQTSNSFAFGAPVTLVQSTLPLSDLVAGRRFPISFVPRGCRRYVRLYYTVNGSNPSVGAITAAATINTQDNITFPDAVA